MPVEAFVFYLVFQFVVGFFFAVAALGVFFRSERVQEMQDTTREIEDKPLRISKGMTDVLEMSGFEQAATVRDTVVIDKSGNSTVYLNSKRPEVFANIFGREQVFLHTVLESKKILQTTYRVRVKNFPKQVAKRYQMNNIETELLEAINYHNFELDKLIGKNQKPIPIDDIDAYFDIVDWWLSHDFIPFLSWQTFHAFYKRMGLYLPILAGMGSVATAILIVGLLVSETPMGLRENLFVASSAGFILVISISAISILNMLRRAKTELEGA